MVYYKSGPLLTSNLLTVYQSVCLVHHLSLATSGRTVSPMPNLLDSRAVNLCTAPWPLKHNTPRKPFKCYVAEFCCQKNVSESGLPLLFLHLRGILILQSLRYPILHAPKFCHLVHWFKKLFLFLLYDLSFPCRYFFSASMGISMGK